MILSHSKSCSPSATSEKTFPSDSYVTLLTSAVPEVRAPKSLPTHALNSSSSKSNLISSITGVSWDDSDNIHFRSIVRVASSVKLTSSIGKSSTISLALPIAFLQSWYLFHVTSKTFLSSKTSNNSSAEQSSSTHSGSKAPGCLSSNLNIVLALFSRFKNPAACCLDTAFAAAAPNKKPLSSI